MTFEEYWDNYGLGDKTVKATCKLVWEWQQQKVTAEEYNYMGAMADCDHYEDVIRELNEDNALLRAEIDHLQNNS